MNPTITSIHARRVLDSRGWPTLEVEMTSSGGQSERAMVPSGASTGIHEALELRDPIDGKYPFFMNKDVRSAIENVNTQIAPALVGKDLFGQMAIDRMMLEMDATENKSNLGANAILGVSLCAARLSAKERNIPLYKRFEEIAEYQLGEGSIVYKNTLPVPMVNVINGGAHANSNLSIQEFMLMPFGESYSESIAMASDMFHVLQKRFKEMGISIAVGDEGGIALFLDKENFASTESVLEFLEKIIAECGFTGRVKLALDVAASEVYKDGEYSIDGELLDTDAMLMFYGRLVEKFPIYSIEDALGEDDWDGWAKLNSVLGSKVLLVGDDLLVTNKKRLEISLEKNACNAVLVKVNQIGSITETIETIGLAYENGMQCIISHRSGETEDTTIADLSVGVGARFIKTGSMSRSERIAKYNQLLRIEEDLGDDARYKIGL